MNKIQEIINKEEATTEYWSDIAKLDFACLLNKKIDKKNMTYIELAEKTGISKSYIMRILSGDANFTIDTMVKLIFALNERINITAEPLRSVHMDIEKMFRHDVKIEFQQPEYEENYKIELLQQPIFDKNNMGDFAA